MAEHRDQEDFGALLREEILAAKKRRQEAVETVGGSRYVKRGDLERPLGKKIRSEQEGPGDEEAGNGERVEDLSSPAIVRKGPRTSQAGTEEAAAGEGPASAMPTREEREPTVRPKKTPKPEIYHIGVMESACINPKEEFAKITPLMLLFLKRLLHEQELSLDERSDAEKASQEGRLAASIFVQTQGSLRILFKLLRKNTVPKDILKRLAEICSFMQQREYVQANDAYLKLAIGNAPWPIGVTAVGIHERSAQEKIKTNQIARTQRGGWPHAVSTDSLFCSVDVLNDETTRKWLQSVKRLMTFCQHKYPPKDRSKLVRQAKPGPLLVHSTLTTISV